MDCDLDACYAAVMEITQSAGKMVKEAFSQEKRVQTKASIADLVTETDQAVEKLIIGSLRERFPSHKFIGEESVAGGEKCHWTDEPTWIIDPIDGTTNFVHTFPFTCISIALSVKKKIEIGVIYNMVLNQMYTARNGQGSFCNGQKLSTSKVTDVGQSLVMSEFGSGRVPNEMELKMTSMKNIISKAHGIRCMGSCALAMCAVAAGNADAYYEHGIHIWDMAAADLIVREAGGVVYDPKGGDVDLLSRRVLCAGTAQLANQLAPLIMHVDQERD